MSVCQRKHDSQAKLFLDFKTMSSSWVWEYMPIMPAIRRLRQEDLECKASRGYIVSSRLALAM
jgi:hypothetical protein